MSRTVSLRCHCGTLCGAADDISPATDSRAICYCDDCQIYALHLGASGVLDERGGTDACLLSPRQVHFDQGVEHLRCVRLSPKGLYRWYAGCCNTPLGNTLGPRVPVVILVHSCMDHSSGGRTRDEDLGPAKLRMLARFAKGGPPPGAHPKTPPRLLIRFLRQLARSYFGGRSKPSPFWTDQGQPRAEPRLMDRDEREALRARIHASTNLHS